MPPRTLVIVNPASRNGATRRSFLKLEPRLREVLGPLEVDWTKAPRDAERLAREGVTAGVERILVAGGDGTASEVVSGILASDLGDEVEIGLLPFGTGADLARGLGLAGDVQAAMADIALGHTRRIDAGLLEYLDGEGKACRTHFINSATIGISGLICAMVNQTTKLFGGTFSFLIGTIRALVGFQPAPLELWLDGRKVYEGEVVLATANNGCYFGGGMKGSPRARFDDGLLDVVVIPGLTKWTLFSRLPTLYPGTHVDVAGVEYFQGRQLEVKAAAGAQPLEIDGEPLGFAPARFSVVPEAINLVGARETGS
jgi:YegS/Rv2252/BmrU family lipid kinase